MGLAKVTDHLTYTLVGTPDYMAPEVINCTGHNKTVDWWMLGVLLFELLVGRPPFEADSTEKVYESVRKGIDAVVFPPECRKASDLVRALCHQEPEERIGANETRRDQWYRGFDWPALRACRVPPPHVPRVKGPRDLSNFRSCDQEDPPRVPYKDKGTGWDLGFEDEVPSPAVAASVGALPVQNTSATTSTPPVEAPSRGQAATIATTQAEALAAYNLLQAQASSPRNVPPWAWTTSACPKPAAGPPSLHMSGNQQKKSSKEHSQNSKAAVAWPQRDMPSSPVVGGA
jgi:serine/threonine protein kinase